MRSFFYTFTTDHFSYIIKVRYENKRKTMNIYNQTIPKLEEYFLSFGENPAKAKIVFSAIYRDKIRSFSEINIVCSAKAEN